MKKIITLTVLAASTVATASERKINDLMYLPQAGTTYGISQGSYLKQNIENDGPGETDQDGITLSQTFGHAFTDRFSLSATLDYANLTTDPSGAGQSESHTRGISDPTVGARFRTMDETFRWDIIGGVGIGLGDHKIDSDGDQDFKQGGNSLYVGTQFGATNEYFQWSLLGQLTHNMEATTKDDTTNTKIKDDANNELLVRGEILNKLASDSYLHSNLGANFTEQFDDDNDGSTAASTTYNLGTEYQQILSQDLMLRAGVDYFMINRDTGNIDNNTGWLLTLGANYQF